MQRIDLQETRNDLAKRFKGVGVEVGVERAIFSEVICKTNPGIVLYGVDPLKAYKGYREHVTQNKLDGFAQEIKERMKDFDFTLIRKFSMDAVTSFADESLDFVYIDANHDYQHAREDMTAWAKKVKKGGIVSGHDYIRRKGQAHLFAVVDAVNDYVKENNIKELFIFRGDRSPSWMFIK